MNAPESPASQSPAASASSTAALSAPLPVSLPGLVVAASAPSSSLSFLRGDEAASSSPAGIGVFSALAVVLFVALIAAWLLRRGGFGRRDSTRSLRRLLGGGVAEGGMKVLQSTRLTPRSSAHVLQWAQGQWLVVCNDQSSTVVAQRSMDGIAVASSNAEGPT